MTTIVDASALLAILHGEDGAGFAITHLRHALLSAVNLAEVLAKASDRACLALAIEHAAPVLTADTKWAELDLGIDIRLIR